MTTTAKILLVEDDQSLLDGISDLLEVVDLGYELTVLTASNGRDGLRIMNETMPDLVISDIMMPKMGGFEFLEHLRNNSSWIHIPVIFLSARGTKADIRAGRISGAELYITKPFDNDELLEMVRSQLDRTFELRFDRMRRYDNLQRNIIQLLNHEFRTPLTYVTAYYEMLEDGLANQSIEFIQEYLRGIQVGAVRMTRLIDNFVRVIELRTGETVDYFNKHGRPVYELGAVFRATCLEWKKAQSGKVDIRYRIAADLPPVYGEVTYLKEILDRLIDNAVKFSATKLNPSPRVTILAECSQGDEVCVSVQDNGVGFPGHVANQLFDLFYQYDREKMEQQGSGSGLTVVKGLVELHNGRIEVESKVGEGSNFTVFFPVYKPEAALASNQRKRTPGKKSATVLLVEDEPFLLQGLRELLEIFECEYDLHVLTASNGVEGLEILESHKPDLIITDIMMPRMGGYELLANVRRNPALLYIPVIFLTAKGERQDIIRGRSSGAEEYIVKPYDSDELLELVMKQLDRHFQMQGVIRQDFEALKRGILDLLQPDFRSPLDSVSDYSEKLALSLKDVQTEAEMHDSLKGIQQASHRITRLVEDFIFLAEIRTGEAVGSFELSSRPVNVGLVLLEAFDLCRMRAEENGVTIKRRDGMDLPWVRVDYDKLKSAVQRLINLLVEYCAMYRRGSVTVDAAAGAAGDNETIEVILALNGISFSSEKVEQIDHLFKQESVDGVELSEHDPDLVVTKGIIDLHGGQIRIENEPGKWSRFVIALSVYQAAMEMAAGNKPAAVSELASKFPQYPRRES